MIKYIIRYVIRTFDVFISSYVVLKNENVGGTFNQRYLLLKGNGEWMKILKLIDIIFMGRNNLNTKKNSVASVN